MNRSTFHRGVTRVAVRVKRRLRARRAVAFMRKQTNSKTYRCPVKWHDDKGQGVPWLGHCAHSVACAHGRSFSGWNAIDGWTQTPSKYRHSGKNRLDPPRGALVFWAGGSHGYGHVGISNGRGRFYGVDLPVSGRIGLERIGAPVSAWNLRYLGWIWPDKVVGWNDAAR